jgi:hypothetical protein
MGKVSYINRDGNRARHAMRAAWTDCVGALNSHSVGRASRPDALSPDRLFGALDGRTVTVQGKRWRIEVFSASLEDDAIWLQLALDGEHPYNLLMRMTRDEGPRHAILILSSWLASRAGHPRIVNVA